MANHELYVVQGKTLDNIAGTMRAVLGVDKDAPIRFDEVASSDKTEQINTDIESQTDLIAQIKTALNGKAGSSAAEIGALIDESGVLESTDGTATEKVEQIVEWLKFFTRDIKGVSMATCKGNCIKETPVIDCTNYIYLSSAFAETSRVANGTDVGLEVVRLKNTQNITHWLGTFSNSRALHTIELLDFSSCASALSSTFEYCTSLINLKFVPQTIKRSVSFVHCSKLSTESKQSIFDGLAFVTTAQTLTLNANAKILQSQVDSANAKGWTVAGGTVVSEEEYYG